MPHNQSKAHDAIFDGAGFSLQLQRAKQKRWRIAAQPRHTLRYLTSGEIKWRIETSDDAAKNFENANRANVLRARSALLINPDETLTARAASSSATYLQAAFDSSYLLDCAVRARLVRDDALIRFQPTATSDERLARLLDDVIEELQEAQTAREAMLAALVEQLTLYLLRRYAHIRRDETLELSRAGGLVDRRIRRAVELMNASLERELSLNEIARAAYLSPFHFARLFKKLTGATPHNYHAALRLNHARKLLSETDLSVTEIAARVGYRSSSHFTKAFRQTNGLSPRQFRNARVRQT